MQASVDFSSRVFKSFASLGALAPRTLKKYIYPKFSTFSLNLSLNFEENLKCQKIKKFPLNFSKNYKFLIDCLTFFENIWVWKNSKFLFFKTNNVPPPPPLLPGPHHISEILYKLLTMYKRLRKRMKMWSQQDCRTVSKSYRETSLKITFFIYITATWRKFNRRNNLFFVETCNISLSSQTSQMWIIK